MRRHSRTAILLVDDDDDDAELATGVLCRGGHGVHRVSDGEEALDYLFRRGRYAARERDGPRVVLLDLKMPRLSGFEVLQELRKDRRTREMPVVVLTSSRLDDDVNRAYAQGANSYVVKPVDYGEFARRLGDVGSYWIETNEAPADGTA